MRVILAVLVTLAAVAALAFAFPPHRMVAATIEIAAQPAQVWSVLTDTAAYPAWNPTMVLKGALVQGNVIEHDEGRGADRMVFHPRIVAATPARELAWFGRIGPPRFLDALHSFRLQAANGHTLFTQTETLRGVLLSVYDAGQLLPAFQAMNTALKARVEQRFPSSLAPTTSPP